MSDVGKKVAYVRREVRKGQSRPHHCHALGCTKQVPPAYFMCARHWNMVPTDLQRLVWRYYSVGQEKGEAGVSQEYLDITRRAIQCVAQKERTP